MFEWKVTSLLGSLKGERLFTEIDEFSFGEKLLRLRVGGIIAPSLETTTLGEGASVSLLLQSCKHCPIKGKCTNG